MIYHQFMIKDHKARSFSKPHFAPTIEVAERIFGELAKDRDTEVGRFPQDFSLYRTATVDMDTAETIPVLPIELIGNAADYSISSVPNRTDQWGQGIQEVK